jgi:hybrid cluster-associated redox disulfide protein
MTTSVDPTVPDRITADMNIEDILARYPQTGHVFFRHKLGCAGCYISRFHSVAVSAEEFNVDLDKLLAELNEAANEVRG